MENNSNEKYVILIDDEADLASTMESILEFKGIKVKAFTDVEVAEIFIRENNVKISVVVTDQNMPNKTGLELVKDLQDSGIETPIIIASGSIDEVSSQDNIAGHLEKPYTSDNLVEKIKKIS